MADLTQAQWVAQLNQDEHAVIVDVRTDMEVAQGMIPDAIQIDIQNAASFMEKSRNWTHPKLITSIAVLGPKRQACMIIMNSLGSLIPIIS